MSAGQPEAASSRRGTGVQSVDRVLDILECLATQPRPMGISEIARETGLAQGTVHRLLASLVSRGYVRRDVDRRYGIGMAAAGLADSARNGLIAGAEPVLRDLVDTTGETANLALLDGDQMVYAAQAPSPHTLRIFAEVGRRVPLHCTAVGKAALATLPDARGQALLARRPLEARTEHTLTTVEAVMSDVGRVRDLGHAVDEQEQEIGVRCIAAPLTGLAGITAAVSVSAPTERLPEDAVRTVARAVRRAADRLAEAITAG